MRRWIWIAAVLMALPSPARADRADDSHQAEVEAWRAKRMESLRRPEGWLSLIGLDWLEQGENPFGSDPKNRVRLPASKAPKRAGVFVVEGGQVTVRAERGAGVTHEGKPVTKLKLTADADGDPTVLELGSLRFYVIRRGDQLGIRIKDREHPAIAAFQGIDSYPLDRALRVSARFEPYDPPKKIEIPNVIGVSNTEDCPGAVVFEIDGRTQRLDALDAGDSLWLIFGDATNGRETYGGGRFLYTEKPAEDGTVVVDFNKAYNPPCVFSPYATCPLPPKENKLTVAIRAGEKDFHGEGH